MVKFQYVEDESDDIVKSRPPKAPPKPKSIKKENLTPPGAKKAPQQHQEFFIDFNKIANNSSFQRFIIEAVKMCVPQLKSVSARTSKDVMNKDFNNQIKEMDQAMGLFEIIKHDSTLLREVRSNPLYLKQALKHNSK